MQFLVKSGAIEKQKAGCLILDVQQDLLSTSTQAINTATDGLIESIIKRGDLKPKAGQTLFVQHVSGISAERLLLAAVGETEKAIKPAAFATAAKAIAAELKATAAKDAMINLDHIEVDGKDLNWKVRQLVEAIKHDFYQFNDYKSKPEEAPAFKKLTFLTERKTVTLVKEAIEQGEAVANGRNYTRLLGDLPGNICHPTYLAEQAKELAKTHTKLTTKILGEKEMDKLGMHSLLSVGRGSAQESKLILMDYKGGNKTDKPIILLGKGITFDTGGISLKPGASMDEMKYDMCGSATVFGVMQTILAMDLNINVVGMVAAAENMPSSDASRPGDIVTSMSGQTIEILNTDAEGRLVLCDALTYAERYKPKAVIDIATLTGACIIALGHQTTAVLSNNDDLVNEILTASKEAADKAWQLPIDEEYQSQLDSNFADMANIGGRPAGTITAGCFLSRFAEKYPWAHLDIAGTAWTSGKNKGATGRPVPLLIQYLMNQIEK